MEKRVVLFLVLSLGIIFGYDLLLKELGYSPFSNSPIIDEEIRQDSSQDSQRSDDSFSTPSDSALDSSTISSQDSTKDSEAEEGAVINEEIIVVQTPLVRVGLSNQGGVITSWELKQFLTQTEDSIPVQLVYPNGQYPGPLTLRSEDHEELTSTLRHSPYHVEKNFSELDESHPTGKVTFTYGSDNSDVWVEKALTFHYDSYVVDIEIRTRGIPEKLDLVLGTNFGLVEWGQGFIGLLGSAWMIGEELVKESPEADDPTLRREGSVKWLALQDKYFMSVFIPEDATGLVAKLENESVVSAALNLPVATEGQIHKARLYAGPKQFDVLKSFEIGLEDTIDFGWFIYDSFAPVKAVAKPLFSVLRWINGYTNNFGWSIVLLTCGIKLLFVPLQYKSYKSMQGMKTIQGPVAKLQEKYKDDKQKLNTELMKLYKEHKVNPVGGCLPMFLQMPVFIALFNILYMTIDLRQAPFMLWIHDLSIQDPFYVLPVLMGASMFVQQKIMPTTADPNMAKMMLILPIGLTFLFVTFPAGLVLYWVTNNVLTIAQQFITDRYVLPPKEPEAKEIGKTDSPTSGPEKPDKPGKKKPSSQQASKPSGKSKKS